MWDKEKASLPYAKRNLSLQPKRATTKTMSKFINPFTDYGFKKIFGQEVSKELLIEFLNDLLEGERVITDLTFLNNEQLPIYPGERIAIYDIFCTTDTGEKIIVEMQNRSQVYFKERALYYLSHAIVRQGVKGESWKFDIKAVYGVFFINFLLDELLDMKQIGITLTENGAMYPHASVCGLMFAHPAAEYFSVGKIGEDQLEDYARRRGKSTEEMRKFLAANLQ